MIIDKKGKLFGIVNIIDLFIVFVLIVAVYFVFTKFVSPTVVSNTSQDDVVMKFYVEESPDFVADCLEVGGVVEDELKSVNLGKITDFTISDGFMFTPDAKGQLIAANKEGYSSFEIVSELKGQLFENGVIVSGNKYGVGHRFTIRAGKAKVYAYVSDIQKKGESK